MSTTPAITSPSPGTDSDVPFVVLMPVFNDWIAAGLLISQLDTQLATAAIRADIILVDACSTAAPSDIASEGMTAVRRIDVLRLKRNLGHQRALAVGLCYLSLHRPGTDVIVIDTDGEDLAVDVLRLATAFKDSSGNHGVTLTGKDMLPSRIP